MLIKNRAEFNSLVKVFDQNNFAIYTIKNIGPHKIQLVPKEDRERLVFSLKGGITVNQNSLKEKDMAYVSKGQGVVIDAENDAVIYIAEALAKTKYESYVKKYADAERINIGEPTYRRTVVTSIGENEKANSFIAGYVENSVGEWSSYPPHKHDTKPEAYIFYGINPGFAVQLILDEEEQRAYVVHDFDTVLIPKGYHPHVNTSLTGSNYAWVIAAPIEDRKLTVTIHPAFKDVKVGRTHYQTK